MVLLLLEMLATETRAFAVLRFVDVALILLRKASCSDDGEELTRSIKVAMSVTAEEACSLRQDVDDVSPPSVPTCSQVHRGREVGAQSCCGRLNLLQPSMFHLPPRM